MAMSYAEAKIWNDEHLPILNRIGITTGVQDERYGDPAGASVVIVYTVHGRLKRAAWSVRPVTKRRDRNRTARRRKRVYVYRWTSEEDPLYVRAAQILQTITEKENPNAKLRTRDVRRH